MRLRVKFKKCGPVRFASHRDVVRIIQRGVAAAEVPVSYTQGYHPHMRMSFGPPLKTGWEGFDEYLDIHFDRSVANVEDRCNPFMPNGLKFVACSGVLEGVPKLANDISAATYEIRVRAEEVRIGRELSAERFEQMTREIESRFTGEDGDGPRLTAVSAHLEGDDVRIGYTSTMHSGRVVQPQEVLDEFGFAADLPTPVRVTRTAQFVVRNGEYLSPLNEGVLQGTT